MEHGFTRRFMAGSGLLFVFPAGFLFQQGIQAGKSFEGRRRLLSYFFGRTYFFVVFLVYIARMLVVVAKKAEKFPIAAVGRIVVMIVVFVVDREFAKALAGELSSATGAYGREELHCPFPVAFFPLFAVSPCFGYHLIEFVAVGVSVIGHCLPFRLLRGWRSILVRFMRVCVNQHSRLHSRQFIIAYSVFKIKRRSARAPDLLRADRRIDNQPRNA